MEAVSRTKFLEIIVVLALAKPTLDKHYTNHSNAILIIRMLKAVLKYSYQKETKDQK